jgi:hypothetical protein
VREYTGIMVDERMRRDNIGEREYTRIIRIMGGESEYTGILGGEGK